MTQFIHLILDIAPSPVPQKTQLNESKTAQVVVQYADPNSPLHSAKSFEELGL